MYPKYSTRSTFFSDSPRATAKEPPPPSGLLSIVVVSRDPLQPRRQLPASQHERHSEPDHGGEWGGRGRRAQVVDAAPGEQAAAGERSMRETCLCDFRPANCQDISMSSSDCQRKSCDAINREERSWYPRIPYLNPRLSAQPCTLDCNRPLFTLGVGG